MKTYYRTLPTRAASAFLFACAMTLFIDVQSLQAQALTQCGPIPFHVYDMDSNGFIAQNEFNTIRSQRMTNRATQGYPMRDAASKPDFTQFDTDQDGQLSPDELAFGQQRQMQQRWDMRQSQGSGMGMRQGGQQGRGMGGARNRPRFEDFDQNKDGLLTPDEFAWGQQQQMQKRWDMMRQSQGSGMGMRQGQGQGRGRNMPRFEDFDGNKDGYISEQELIEARSMRISQRIQQGYQMRNTANIPQFQEIDKNSDAKISPEEFSEHQRQHQMQRQRAQ